MAEYIEREAFIKYLRKTADELYDAPAMPMSYGIIGCANEAKAFPAADVRENVRGRWRPYSPLTDTYECDKCGYQVIDESFCTNYCPNCGADMRGKS